MKIAIIGATRGIGFALTKQALEDGHQVTVLARVPSTMLISHQNLSIIEGSAEDPEAIKKIVTGQDVICDCLGTKNVTKPQTMFSKSAENISKAIKPEQLLIAVTGLGAGDSKGHCSFLYDTIFMPLVLKRQYDDKNRQEEIIMKNIKRWIIVRPGFLTNGKRTGKYNAISEMTGKHGARISREDVADFILSQVKTPTFLGKTPMLVS
ncbi:SDR family oxidoreductase [Flavobacterium sp. NRK F10]|uniref:SDR family oxidoreductase n=1 Tax=Flavobacterium sp. NRK F10 TaxID=2954931 RepID=UPI0020903BC7|nr:SDR family oxidoreductase [Flavobacterium sp. NRK F10]MCO6175924.1 SDR family oxidoreductase [Flavobacterium sp. NRK F10]